MHRGNFVRINDPVTCNSITGGTFFPDTMYVVRNFFHGKSKISVLVLLEFSLHVFDSMMGFDYENFS